MCVIVCIELFLRLTSGFHPREQRPEDSKIYLVVL